MTTKKQAFSVRLNRDAYNMLMRQPQSMRIELGDAASFMYIDGRPFDLNLRREQSSTIQLYEKDQSQDDLRYVGDVTHVGLLKQVSDEDKKRTRTDQVDKNARRIELLDVPSIPTPANPTKRMSPIEGPALQSLRERLIHLLALDPRPTDQLTQMLKVASVDLLPLLKKVAVFTHMTWCLRPEVFKDIRIWEWTRYDDKERATVCRKAEEAYDFLKLGPKAPERANLVPRKVRKPSPKLIPPPSQHTPSHSVKNGASTPSLDSTARKHADQQKPSKKRKIEKPIKKPSEPPTKSLASPANLTPTKKSITEPKKQKPSTTTGQRLKKEPLHDLSGTDLDDDEDERQKTYVAPTIQTQMDFDTLCKEHHDTQQDYIQFKKTFVQNHPIYIQALTAVNEQDKDLFARKLKAYYKSKGGDMNKWRHLMQLSRRFNGTHAKINIMWDTIEKAYRQKRFTLRFNRTHSPLSSSPYSASSSISPLSTSSPLPPPRTKRSSRRG